MNSKFNLFGDIVDNDAARWFESDVTPALFIGWLNKQDGKDVEVNVNSNGGSVPAGLAIANAIKAYPGNVRVNVLGLAASMASVVACAADELALGKGAFLMVHNPWASTVGEADDLRKEADVLDAMKQSIIGFYQMKFGKTADELAAIMDAETWIAADEAEAYALASVPLADDFKAAACVTRRAFAKAPEAAKALFSVRPREIAAPEDAAAQDWEARYKGASKKINELQARLDKAALETVDYGTVCAERDRAAAERDEARSSAERAAARLSEFEDQVKASGFESLAALVGAVSGLKADLEKRDQDLAAAREQLDRANAARDTLNGSVLSPAAESFAKRMVAARTPEEREALRAQKRAGKIK